MQVTIRKRGHYRWIADIITTKKVRATIFNQMLNPSLYNSVCNNKHVHVSKYYQ